MAAIAFPVLAVASSIVGSLLGVMLATKARMRRGRHRVRLLIYAALAAGGAGIWQSGVIATLTFDANGSPVRYDPWLLAAGGVAGVGLAGLAFATVCREELRPWRLVLGGLILATAIGATNFVLVASIRVAGSTVYDPVVVTSSGAIAIVPALAAMWFVAAVRRLWTAVLTAMAVGAGVCATDFVSLAAVRVRLDPNNVGIPGLEPLSLGISLALFGSAGLAMLWFFTLGTSTVGDVQAMLACEPSVAIEPWLIREIIARTSGPIAHTNGLPAAFNWRSQDPAIEPVWRTMLIWGASPNSRLADPPTNGHLRRPPASRLDWDWSAPATTATVYPQARSRNQRPASPAPRTVAAHPLPAPPSPIPAATRPVPRAAEAWTRRPQQPPRNPPPPDRALPPRRS